MARKKEYRSNDPLMLLKKKREALVSLFLKGGTGDFLHQNTRILDEYFHETYERSAIGPAVHLSKNPYALIALGGYGRQEQCVHSDVDLLFLFEKEVPEIASDLVAEVVFPLWDIGFEVGHATRSLEECISGALEDIEVLTALLDARFIFGISAVYSRLMDRLREDIVSDQSEAVIDRLIHRNEIRHQRFGDSTYLLEPNLKEGRGGLRDYHTILWIARVRNQLTQPRDLEYLGCLSHDEYVILRQALSFIWNVRNRLHLQAGKKCDQLYFRHQEKLAQELAYRPRDGQQPVERFLGELHHHMNFLKQQERMRVYEIENEKIQKRGRKSGDKTRFNGVELRSGMLYFGSSEKINQSPEVLIQIFEESARLKIPLSAESKRLVRSFLHRVDHSFRSSPAILKSFERILLTPVPRFNVLEAMSETGFLPTYIPQFNEIVDRIQYDAYHLHPVDKHSLRTVQTIKTFGTPEDPTRKPLCGESYHSLQEEDQKALLWAALCHDIGKGAPGGDHSTSGERIVREILSEKNYSAAFIETVAFLVREHLFLVKTATRRDILDEETAIFCARRINDVHQAILLYLLTVADCVATGPMAWNDWTAALIEMLFLNVMNTIQNGELTSAASLAVIEEKKIRVLGSREDRLDVESLLKVMSPRYLLYTSAEDIIAHIALYQTLNSANFVWRVEKNPAVNVRTVTICARDCPGLFSKIAGVFTLNGIDILDAQVFTWRNNIALDVFGVRPPPDAFYENEKWEKAENDLESALIGTLDLGPALAERMTRYGAPRPVGPGRKPRVKVDNQTSSFFTIIEVFAHDFPGLLYGVTHALFKCRLDVVVAKIATKVDQVVDVFYVRDFDGQKVDAPAQVEAITAALEAFLLEASSPEGPPSSGIGRKE